MNGHPNPCSAAEDTANRVLAELKSVVAGLQASLSHATKTDLHEMERRLTMLEKEELDAINAMSAAADSVSLKVDKVQADVTGLITLVKAGGQPSQAVADAIAKLQASTAALAAGGDKLDTTIAAADAVLPAPAPAGTP